MGRDATIGHLDGNSIPMTELAGMVVLSFSLAISSSSTIGEAEDSGLGERLRFGIMPHVGLCIELTSADWVFACGYCVCMKHYYGRTDSTGQVRWRSSYLRWVGKRHQWMACTL